jgi:hypothetical protein
VLERLVCFTIALVGNAKLRDMAMFLGNHDLAR